MPDFISDSPLANELIRIGDEAIAREDEVALRAYFAEDYVFHGPGTELNFDQLRVFRIPSGSLRPPGAHP